MPLLALWHRTIDSHQSTAVDTPVYPAARPQHPVAAATAAERHGCRGGGEGGLGMAAVDRLGVLTINVPNPSWTLSADDFCKICMPDHMSWVHLTWFHLIDFNRLIVRLLTVDN